MSTKITISYKDKDYTLEFSRFTAKTLEDNGFVLDQLGEKPITMIPKLVYGAFAMHNRGIKRDLVDEIFANLKDKIGEDGEKGFITTLAEMYAEAINSLVGDNKDAGNEGNSAVWTVTRG